MSPQIFAMMSHDQHLLTCSRFILVRPEAPIKSPPMICGGGESSELFFYCHAWLARHLTSAWYCTCPLIDNWASVPDKWSVQLRTTKVYNLRISGTRFFGGNLMTVLKSDRQKELKNGVFMLFPRVFGRAKNLNEFFCILHHHLSQSLRKILLIKLICITLCMSISSAESSASLASFFLCNWCDSRDLVISSSSSPSLTVWRPPEMMSLMEWKSKKGYFGGLQGCNVF